MPNSFNELQSHQVDMNYMCSRMLNEQTDMQCIKNTKGTQRKDKQSCSDFEKNGRV